MSMISDVNGDLRKLAIRELQMRMEIHLDAKPLTFNEKRAVIDHIEDVLECASDQLWFLAAYNPGC